MYLPRNSFDITFTGYVNQYLAAVKRGGHMDITALIDEHTPALKSALPEYAWEAARVDGKIC
jgi:ABC-type glycerol-3-phosphate transport system substrate-binding protein